MSASVSRRTIAKGAAWAVPAVVVGAAAPAMAASAPPLFSVVSATAPKGGVQLTLGYAPAYAGFCFTSLTSTGTKALTWSTASVCLDGSGRITLVADGSNSGNDFSGTYTLAWTITLGSVTYSGTLDFTAVK